MSTALSTSASQSNFLSIFNAALESYKRKTKKDLASHPLLPRFQSCDSPEAILTVLREQVPAFGQFQNRDDGLTKWVTPTVNVLCSFSDTIGQGVGLVSTKTFRHEELPRYRLFSGIPASKCGVCRDRRPCFGWCPASLPCATYFDTECPRRFKIRVLYKTSLSISSTVSNIFSIDSKYTAASRQLWQ